MLTDVFQKCIDTCADVFSTNPFYSYSTPKFKWILGVKLTELQLKYEVDAKFR